MCSVKVWIMESIANIPSNRTSPFECFFMKWQVKRTFITPSGYNTPMLCNTPTVIEQSVVNWAQFVHIRKKKQRKDATHKERDDK